MTETAMQATILVGQDSLRAEGDGNWAGLKGNKRGELVIIDWFSQMMLEGRGFQVRAGTITTPVVGKASAITDTAAEMSVDAPSGTTVIPVFCNISIRLNAKTLNEGAIKSVAAASSAGTVFVPLPLLTNSAIAAVATARAQAAGSVTVAAETVTTTRRHYALANPVTVGAGNEFTEYNWKPRVPPVLNGIACCYLQLATDTTGMSYYASLDWIELPTINVS